jgi:MarR family transcriptional regulator, organic hydroperoxide resistance regulator
MDQQIRASDVDRLLAQVCRLHHGRAHVAFASLGLHRGQPPLLFALWRQEGLTHTQLAERLEVTPATITRMVQRMERAGFVRRQADPNDERVSRVHLTEVGRAIREDVDRALGSLAAESFAEFSPDDLAHVHELLSRVRDNLAAVAGQAPGC